MIREDRRNRSEEEDHVSKLSDRRQDRTCRHRGRRTLCRDDNEPHCRLPHNGLGHRPDPLPSRPLEAAGVQVKGASSGLKVWQKYSTQHVIIAHVLDPLGDDPIVGLCSPAKRCGDSLEYVERGWRASDYEPHALEYRRLACTRDARQDRRAAGHLRLLFPARGEVPAGCRGQQHQRRSSGCRKRSTRPGNDKWTGEAPSAL